MSAKTSKMRNHQQKPPEVGRETSVYKISVVMPSSLWPLVWHLVCLLLLESAFQTQGNVFFLRSVWHESFCRSQLPLCLGDCFYVTTLHRMVGGRGGGIRASNCSNMLALHENRANIYSALSQSGETLCTNIEN